MMFAAIITLAVLGTLAGLCIRVLHRRIVFWERRGRDAKALRAIR